MTRKHIFLGPVGDPDPTDFINMETERLPFKQSRMKLSDWSRTFRTWPNQVTGWRNWFRRIADKKQDDWERVDINQCIVLSLFPFLVRCHKCLHLWP